MKKPNPIIDAASINRSRDVPEHAASDGNINQVNKPARVSQTPTVLQMQITALRIEKGMQIRASLDQEAMADYAERMVAGEVFPPVVVYHDGDSYLLVDGFHRVAAANAAGRTEISCEVYEGSRRDALIAALGANAQHGLRRTNADKRRAVEVALKEFAEMSDRVIADMCGVGNQLVGHVRDQLCDSHSTEPRVGKDGKKRQQSAPAKKRQKRKVESSETDEKNSGQRSASCADEPVSASDPKPSSTSAAVNVEERSNQAEPFQFANGTKLPAAEVAEGWVTAKWLAGKLKNVEACRKPLTPMQKQWCSQCQRILLDISNVLNQAIGSAPSPDDLSSVQNALCDLRNYVVTHPNYKHGQ